MTTEFEKYQAAVNTFRDKYFALPGDMPNATQFWGAAHATPATCVTTVGAGTQTCNGNGDGQVTCADLSCNELFRFWQQLANAGLIEGAYNGVEGSVGVLDGDIGVNVPRSKINNAGYVAGYTEPMSGDPSHFDGDYGHVINFGAEYNGPPSGGGTILPAVTPEEAWNVDTKMDDGKPGYGKVRSYKQANEPNCATSNVASTAEYNLAYPSIGCGIKFLQAF